MSKGIEVIKHAAVKANNGMIFIGKSHGDCAEKFLNVGITGVDTASENSGFLTSMGRFVGRSEAAGIAFSADQIDKCTNVLFSEDLWDEEYQGKYNYDEIKGYILKKG